MSVVSAAPVSFPRDGLVPAASSELTCGVCGESALDEDTPHEFARGLSTRLICQVCGAHRVTEV